VLVNTFIPRTQANERVLLSRLGGRGDMRTHGEYVFVSFQGLPERDDLASERLEIEPCRLHLVELCTARVNCELATEY
jgi:hypothetical protein